LGEPLT